MATAPHRSDEGAPTGRVLTVQDRIDVPGAPLGITLERWGPEQGAPVVLVPGLGASPLAFRLHPRESLVAALSARGRTPWTVDFGVSWRGRNQGAAALRHGLELAVVELRRHLGVELDEIDAIGHSLGGILLLALLADGVPLRRVVTLASGIDYRLGKSPLPRLLSLAPKGMRPLRLPAPSGGVPLRGLARVGASAFGRGLGLPVEKDQFHPGNTDPETLRRAVRDGVRDLPWALLFDLTGLFSEEGIQLGLQGYPLRAAVRQITQPVLMVGAAQDRQCPIESVRDAARRVPGSQLIVLGSGEPGWGHLDLLTGADAPERVFAPTCAFLDADAPDRSPHAA